LFCHTVSKRRNSSRIIINLVNRTVVIAPDIALVLLTVPYFIAVIATIVYTNKLIKTGKITAAATSSSDSEYPDNDYDKHNVMDLIDNSNSDNDSNSKSIDNNKLWIQTIETVVYNYDHPNS